MESEMFVRRLTARAGRQNSTFLSKQLNSIPAFPGRASTSQDTSRAGGRRRGGQHTHWASSFIMSIRQATSLALKIPPRDWDWILSHMGASGSAAIRPVRMCRKSIQMRGPTCFTGSPPTSYRALPSTPISQRPRLILARSI
jgi:hypothetical protein